MFDYKPLEIWFATGSQSLYGNGALEQVGADSGAMVGWLNGSTDLPVHIVFKSVLKNSDEILRLCLEANASSNCIGVITWMHTFSPAKMWIAGLHALDKPMLHLHTQFNREIPWSSIDMDFMNLNQSAHGGREFGYICTRMGKQRKVVVGHWQNTNVLHKVDVWMRAAAAWHDSKSMKIARFGDNMRNVAVTEGDKVDAQIRFGYSVNGYSLCDLLDAVHGVSDVEVDQLVGVYDNHYEVAEPLRFGGELRESLRDAARIELGLRHFLETGNFTAFTNTFENLYKLKQLPGLPVQRLMADGYGFGAEGDWKTAALVRSMKVMGTGLPGGTSFMEDYTYHMPETEPNQVLGAHMLEVCESIAGEKPSLEIHPLSIGGKADPVRLVFDTPAGPGLNCSVIDLGNRMRMVVNTVDVVQPEFPMPRLPVARALWVPHPNLQQSAAAWIYAGAAHHSGFSQAITTEHLRDFAEIADIEFVLIDQDTKINELRKELRWNEMSYAK